MYPIEVTIVGPPPGRSVWGERYKGTWDDGRRTHQAGNPRGRADYGNQEVHVGTCSYRM